MKTGYTLIETLTALSILSIFGAACLSFTHSLVSQNTHSVEIRKLISALQYTRMAAIRYGGTVIFCGSNNFQQCDGDWQKGQIIQYKGQVLQVFPGLRSGDYWEWRSSLGRNHQVEFSALGFTRGQQGSFYYHTNTGDRIYRIVLSHSGAIRVEKM